MRRRPVGTAVVTTLCVVAGAVGFTAPAAAAATQEGTIGGSLHAEMYPSGLEADADGSVIIADTANNQVTRYDADGNLLWRVGEYGDGVGQFDNPRDIGIDSSGNIYVADTRNSRIVKLDPDGNWLDADKGPNPGYNYPLGVSVADDIVYVGDTGRHRVVATDTSLNTLSVVQADGECSNIRELRDADADSAGNIYVAGYKTNEILKFDAAGTCVGKWGSTGTGPGQFRTPYGVDLAVDPVLGRELVHVADGLNSRVQVFELDGTYVYEYGTYGESDELGTVTTMRRVSVVPDGSGDMWTADLWGQRSQKWNRTTDGATFELQVGGLEPAPTSTAVFHEPRGIAFTPSGETLVVDTVHHRFARFNSDGDLLGTCGERAVEGATLGQYNWPRGIAVDQQTGDIWVADTKQNRLQVLAADCTPELYIGDAFRGSEPNQWDWPYDIDIRESDRVAWVTDTQNNRIKSIDVATREVIALHGLPGGGPDRYRSPGGIEVHPSTGHVYVADTGNNRIVELSDTGGAEITYVGAINAGRSLNAPEGLAIDEYGTLWVADSGDDEIVRLLPDGTVLETIPDIKHPGNLEFGPDGRLYVSDTYRDVVKVFSITAPPAPDAVEPETAIASPTSGQTLPVGTVTVSGTASDNEALAGVEVAVQRGSDKLWLQPNGSWGSFTRNPAVLTDPGQPASDWALSFTVDAASGFYVEARAADAAGLTDQSKARVSFQVSDQTDAAAPTGTVTAPTNGASVQSPVSITGTADDDVAVAQVRLGIKRASTGEWWNGSTWQGSWATVEADLASPGAASTTWSYTFDAPATGDYGFATMITDTAGKSASGADKPGWVSFTVADEIVTDDASPSGTVTAPANGALVGSPVSITGTADDDVAVAQVRLGIKRASTGEWWNGSTWQGSWATVEADLASPGAASTTWSYTFDAPATGDYGFATMITDTAGKSASGADKPGWTQFTVVP